MVLDNNYEWVSQDIMEDMVRTIDGGIAAGWFYAMGPISSDYKQYAWVLKTDSNGCGKPVFLMVCTARNCPTMQTAALYTLHGRTMIQPISGIMCRVRKTDSGISGSSHHAR